MPPLQGSMRNPLIYTHTAEASATSILAHQHFSISSNAF